MTRAALALAAAALLGACTFGTAIIGGDAGRADRADGADDIARDRNAPDAPDAATAMDALDAADGADAAADVVADTSTVECRRNADCVDPTRPVCDIGGGRCVQCLPAPDTCPTRRFCDPTTLTCQDGCRRDADCVLETLAGDGGLVMRRCDLDRRICVACRTDGDCAAGLLCAGGVCSAGCGAGAACAAGETCCGGACVDTARNDANCGACGRGCVPAAATGLCVEGRCAVGACVGPFGDCDADPANGCETPLRTNTDCGACRAACPVRPNASPRCDVAAAACAFTCDAGWADCNGLAADGCEVDTRASLASCGACGRACAAANGTARCDEGRCAIASCAAGFADCDGDATNGCEADTRASAQHCGACGARCAAGANAVARCESSRCASECAAGFADCNGDRDDGCEVDTRTSAQHCGACGAACGAANATAACAAGRCAVTRCDDGWSDCNGSASDGCEVQTATSLVSCGRCGVACAEGQLCVQGTCGSVCASPRRECAGLCVDPSTDARNCGACGAACAAGRRREAGICRVECASGLSSCGEVCADLAADPANCGACGVACPNVAGATGVCRLGRCGYVCRAGYADCDGAPANGCEGDLLADAANCGTCGFRCAPANATGVCRAGGCGIGACAAGSGDCNRDAADGCETSLRRDDRNCGACGTACALGTACANGVCAPPPGSLYVDAPAVINTIAAAVNAGVGAQTVTLLQPTGTFSAGQRVLFHQTQGPAEVAGRYELARVVSVTGAAVTLDHALAGAYTSGAAARAQVVVVPEYTSVTVTPRGSLTAPPWDGRVGGVLALESAGDVTVLGAISMDGRGFRGPGHGCATSRLYQCAIGAQGESFVGLGRLATAANGSGGGGGASGQDCAAGGGGANGAAGYPGTSGDCNGGDIGECTSACPNVGGGGGSASASAALSAVAHLGGAGGEGGADEDGAFPGAGGNGGGFIRLRVAGALTVVGTITASGSSGRNGNQADCGGDGCGMGGGGGGAGGSIRLDVDGSVGLGDGRLLAIGGTGGLCSCRVIDLSRASPGGDGGAGRIAVRGRSVTGASDPAYARE